MGQAPPGADCNTEGRGTPFVKAGEFGLRRPIIREWTTKPLKMASNDDVLICVVGATAGKLNLGAECAIGRSVAAIRPSEAIESAFLYPRLKSEVMRLRADSTGTAQGVISRDMLADIPLALPPKSEQRRIVTKLDALTACLARARVELDRVPMLTNHLRRAVLTDAFGSEIEPSWATLGTILEAIDAGKNLKCEERPPVSGEAGIIKVSAVSAEEFRPGQAKTVPPTYSPPVRDLISSGDVLLARASGSLNLVGRVALVKEDPSNLYLSDKVLRLRFQPGLALWAYWFLRSPSGRRQIEDLASGISMHNITQPSLRALKLPVPGVADRAKVLANIDGAFSRADRLEAEAARTRALLDRLETAILGKAFRGELVPQDPNDELASVLLDRIRAQRAGAPKTKRGRPSLQRAG